MTTYTRDASPDAVTRTRPRDAVSVPIIGFERGDWIDRYLVLGVAGEGGSGVVYCGYDPDLERKVAIKLLKNVADQIKSNGHDC